MLSILLFVLIIIFLAIVSSFIPIGNENSTVRRLPWITFSIMAINVIIFYVTLPVVGAQQSELMKIGLRMEQYVQQHPELLADDGVRKKLTEVGMVSKGEAEAIEEQLQKSPELASQYKEWLAGLDAQRLREELDNKISEFKATAKDSLWYKYGLAPNGDWKIYQLITAAFLHGGGGPAEANGRGAERSMDKRKLGSSGIEIAPLMLGGNVLGWTADEATSFKLLDSFVAAGLNAVDTADTYSTWVPGHKGGESETIIGNWLQARGGRDKVVIATKVGWDQKQGGLAGDRIMAKAEASLRRLKTDYIDLYQSHIDDTATPLEETLAAHQRLIEQGKVRAIGCSNYTAPRLAEALRVSAARGLPRYQSLQPHYNLYNRADYERELEPLVLKEGIGVIPYYSLASGFLTGKYRSEADLGKSPRGHRPALRRACRAVLRSAP